jgi:hypothetical protein
MEHLAPAPSANGSSNGYHPAHASSATPTAVADSPGHAMPGIVKESTVRDFGLLDQLHSLYADKDRLETAIGMSDSDDVITHVMRLRREQAAARADLETAMSILVAALKRLDAQS